MNVQDFAVVVLCQTKMQQALGLSCWSSDYKLQLFNSKPSFGFAATWTCFQILSLSALKFQIALYIFMMFFFVLRGLRHNLFP